MRFATGVEPALGSCDALAACPAPPLAHKGRLARRGIASVHAVFWPAAPDAVTQTAAEPLLARAARLAINGTGDRP